MLIRSHQFRATFGFTILELVAALGIMAVLASVVVVGLGGLMPASKSKRASTDIVRIQQALESYKGDFGEYPKRVAVEGASPSMEAILFNALAGTLAPNGSLGNFSSRLDRYALEFENETFPIVGAEPDLAANALVDPWGNAYQYRFDPVDPSWENFNYVLFSAGPDGLFAEVTDEGQKNEGQANNLDNIYAQ